MKNPKISLLFGAGIIIAGFLISSVLSNQKTSLERTDNTVDNKEIKTVRIENKDLNISISSSGRLTAFNKIEIFAEVTGVLDENSIRFKEGNNFKKNDILVQIDDRVYRNNLLAQKSSLLNQLTLLLPDLRIDFPDETQKWEKYLADFDLNLNMKPLPKAGSNQEKYYIASRNIYNLFYSVKSMEATLDKYNIRAPYDGIVTESEINPGTLVRSGQKLGEFTNTSVYELAVAIGIKEVKYLRPGMQVKLTSQDINNEFSGRIARVNNSIDQASQTVKVFIQASDARLRDGLYLMAEIETTSQINVAEIPRSALTKTNYVYMVNENEALDMQKVEIIKNENSRIFVSGLDDGITILSNADDSISFNHTAAN